MSSIAFTTAISLGVSWLYYSSKRKRVQSVDFVLSLATVLHTCVLSSKLAFHRPQNLFMRLGIPINTPVDIIRSLLINEAGLGGMGVNGDVVVSPEIPRFVDTLLSKLGVHGGRDIYVRFGQRAMQTCQYCSSTSDYTLFVLSDILLDYLRTATLLLLLTTIANGRQRWRKNVLGALACAFLAEAYGFTSASAVPLQKDVIRAFMWHDNLFLARNMIFLALPIVIQVLPATYPPPPASVVLAPALERLERTLARAHLLKYFRQAALRHPYTRERVVEFWANNATEGAAARSDPVVQMTASKLGLGFATPTGSGEKDSQESTLRMYARAAVHSLKPLFVPSPN